MFVHYFQQGSEELQSEEGLEELPTNSNSYRVIECLPDLDVEMDRGDICEITSEPTTQYTVYLELWTLDIGLSGIKN